MLVFTIMTTLREALIQAREQFDELPAGEIRRLVDNVLNDGSLTDSLGGWPVEVCRTDSVDSFYSEVEDTPF